MFQLQWYGLGWYARLDSEKLKYPKLDPTSSHMKDSAGKPSEEIRPKLAKRIVWAVLLTIVIGALIRGAFWTQPHSPPISNGAHAWSIPPRQLGSEDVPELVAQFTTNRDKTKALSLLERIKWKLLHPGAEFTPLVVNSAQSDAAFELIQLGPKAKAAAPAMIRTIPPSSPSAWFCRSCRAP